jgi:hypothetical protein
MQEILGEINDGRVALTRIEQVIESAGGMETPIWRRYRTGVEYLRRIHEMRIQQHHKCFENWWEQWHTAGHAAAFDALLVAKPSRNDHSHNPA